MNKFRIVDTRFRILKGGKIGLAMSIALIGGVLTSTTAQAGSTTIVTVDAPHFTVDESGQTSTATINYGKGVLGVDYGILLQAASNTLDYTQVVNNGSIKVTDGNLTYGSAEASAGIATGLSYTDLNNNDLDVLAGTTSIKNSSTGTIDVNNTSVNDSAAFGVLGGYVTGSASITNDGDISVNSNSDLSDSLAAGVSLTDINQAAKIVNSSTGSITASSTGEDSANATGITIISDINSNPSDVNASTAITNAGAINVTANSYNNDAFASGININAITGENVTITNSGDIEAHAASFLNNSGAVGIVIGSSLLGQTKIVGADGSITVSSQDDSTGIYINGNLEDNASVSSGDMDIISTTSSVFSNADGITIDGDMSGTTKVSTVGTMNVTSVGGYASGINVSDMSQDSGILNSGVMTVEADKYAVGISASGMYDNAKIDTNGSISVTSNTEGARGIDVRDMNEDSSILNSGIITVDGYYATGINASDMYDNASVTNSGAITVDANQTATGISASYVYGNAKIDTNGSISVTSTTGDAKGISASTIFGNGSITNSGDMNVTAAADAYGIHDKGFDYEMENTASITNNKNITVASLNGFASGILVNADMQDEAKIINSSTGTINVTSNEYDATGIDVEDMRDTASITNSGAITVDANTTAMGITALNMSDDSKIDTNGSISVTSTVANATGIDVASLVDHASIINSGDMNVTASTSAFGIHSTNNVDMNDTASITNSKNITVTSLGEDASGIDVSTNMLDQASIINSGAITVDANQTAMGITTWSMRNDAKIDTNGSISVTSTIANATGINVDDMNGTTSIVNSGAITADANQTATGIYTGYMSNNAKIDTNGSISVSSTVADATGIDVASLVDNTSITNSGDMNVTASTSAFGIHNNGYDGYDMNDTASIINSKNITVTSLGEDASGIDVSANMLDNASIINSGDISVTANQYAVGIIAQDMSDNAKIDTNGSISVSSTYSYATGADVTSLVDNASITNSGDMNVTADASAFGIHNKAYDDMNDTASITNSKNITVTSNSGDAFGIAVDNFMVDNASIINSGDISVTADQYAVGIAAQYVLNNARIDTNSSISVTSNTAEATGIYTYALADNASITNSSTITVSASANAHGIYNYGAADGENIDMDGNTSITNSGTISVTSENESAYGIEVIADMRENAKIINSGDINVTANRDAVGITAWDMYNDATIDTNGSLTVVSNGYNNYDSAIGIDISSLNDNAKIINSGAITVDSNKYAYGINVENGMSGTTSIVNSGTIKVIGKEYYATGIYSEYLYDSASITNSGDMNVTSSYGSAYGIDVYGDMNGTTSVLNSGTITVAASDSARGIYARDLSNNASITNSNDINVTSSDYKAYGIDVNDMHDDANISNSSVITVVAENGNAKGIDSDYMYNNSRIDTNGTVTVTSTNGDATGISVDILADHTSVTNDGTIIVNATDGSAFGIYNYGLDAEENSVDMNDTTSITNNNTIIVTANGEDTSAYGILVDANMTQSAKIINSGDIIVTADNGFASGITTNGVNSQNGNFFTNGDNGLFDDASILTEGSITVTGLAAAGIITGDMNGTASITNSNSISASGDYYAIGIAANVMQNNATITNSGAIDVNATNMDSMNFAIGILAEGLFDNASITTDGPITATGNLIAAGIIAGDMNGTASITNSNNISVTGKYALGINAGDMENNATITNSGAITVTATDGYALGITTNGLFNSGNGLHDNASITTTGSITATGLGAVAIVTGDMNGTASVTNSNSILVSGDYFAMGIAAGAMENNATITNSGDILVDSVGEDAYGIRVDNMDENTTINITSDATLSVDANRTAYALNIGDGNGTISNDGGITATINGDMSKDAYSVYSSGQVSSETDKLTLNNTGTLSGNIHAANLALNNTGTVILPYNAMGEDAAVVDTFTQTADAMLKIGVQKVDGVLFHSQLKGQNITLDDGTHIDVNVMSADKVLLGDADTKLAGVLQATETLSVNVGDLNVTDNSYLLKFVAQLDAADENNNTMDLAILLDNKVLDAVQAEEEVQSSGTAGALDAIINDRAYGGLSDVISALNNLGDAAAIAKATNQLTPVAAVTASAANSQALASVTKVVQERQEFRGGKNSGDALFGEKNAWIKPFGSLATQDAKDGYHGYDVSTGGIGLGFDGEISNTQNIGLALFYTNSDVDVLNLAQSTQIKSYSALLYGDIGIIDETTKLYYQLGYGSQDYDSSRAITFMSSTANANYSGNTAMAMVKVAKEFEVSKSLDAIVGVKTLYANYKTDAYNETALAEAQSVEASDKSQFIAGVEANFIYSATKYVNLLTSAGVSYDFLNERDVITSTFQGQPNYSFDTSSMELSPVSYQLGAGVGVDFKNNFGLNVMYDFDGRDSTYQNHTFSTKLNWRF